MTVKNSINKELYVVDENGEVLDKIESQDRYVKLSDGDKVVRKGVLQYLSDTTDVKYRFIKINPVILYKSCEKYSILPFLISSVGYMDNICEFKNGKTIQIKDLPKLCNKTYSTIKRQLKGLIEDDIIHKKKIDKKVVLIVNPWIALRGRKVYLSLYEEFKLSSLRNECDQIEK